MSAVYDMLGATGHLGKTQELFSKLDANSDGSISQEEFVAVIKQDKSLLDVLQGKQALVWLWEKTENFMPWISEYVRNVWLKLKPNKRSLI